MSSINEPGSQKTKIDSLVRLSNIINAAFWIFFLFTIIFNWFPAIRGMLMAVGVIVLLIVLALGALNANYLLEDFVEIEKHSG